MILLIAYLLASIFFFLSAIHIYWALGGKWGGEEAIPSRDNNKSVINPGPIECFIVAAFLFALSAFILIKSGIIPFILPNWLLSYGLWTMAIVFILRAIGEFKYVGFFKKVRGTQFSRLDYLFYSPLCLLIGIACIFLELSI